MKPLIEEMCEKARGAMNELLKVTDVVREQKKAHQLSQNQVRCVNCKHHTLSPVQRYDEQGRSMGGCRLAHESIVYYDRILWTCPTFEAREDGVDEMSLLFDTNKPPPAELTLELSDVSASRLSEVGDLRKEREDMKSWLEHWTRECSGVDRNDREGKSYCPDCPFKPPCDWARGKFIQMLEEGR